MNLTSTTVGRTCVVTVNEARIDAAVALAFKDQMRAEAERCKGQIVLNLSAVDFIDSSGLGAIVAAMKMLGREQSIVLAGLNPAVEKVFRLTRMDTVFRLYLTLDDALKEVEPQMESLRQ